MNGPAHYVEAERLLLSCQVTPADERNAAIYPAVEDGVDSIRNALAAAQVHATLALAAAAALPAAVAYIGAEQGLWSLQREWTGATS